MRLQYSQDNSSKSTFVDNSNESLLSVQNLWDIEELASYLKISTRTVRNLINRGLLPVIKVGGKIQRFRKESVDEALAKLELKPRYDRISRGGKR